MLLADARRRVAQWREPRAAARIARALWIAWAIIVWNAVFDHVIVVAGRSYIVRYKDSLTNATWICASAPALYSRTVWMKPVTADGMY